MPETSKPVDNVNLSGDITPDAVIETLHAVVHAARSRHHEALRASGAELSPLEGRVLNFFARHPGATQKDLADHSRRDKGQLARLITGLRERGLLESTADPADKRVTRITLSADAQRQHQSMMKQRQKLARTALTGINEAERRALLSGLTRMLHNIQEQG